MNVSSATAVSVFLYRCPQITSTLEKLGAMLTDRSFYLAGGTALALQLGHRRSVDLDWFTHKRLNNPLGLARKIQDKAPGFAVSGTAKGTLHGALSSMRLSFLEYRYPLLKPLASLHPMPIRLASLEDIVCMKLSAITSRGAKKDFIDINALGRSFSLVDMLNLHRHKYGISDFGHVLIALTYFDEADRERQPVLQRQRSWATVKSNIWRRSVDETWRDHASS